MLILGHYFSYFFNNNSCVIIDKKIVRIYNSMMYALYHCIVVKHKSGRAARL